MTSFWLDIIYLYIYDSNPSRKSSTNTGMTFKSAAITLHYWLTSKIVHPCYDLGLNCSGEQVNLQVMFQVIVWWYPLQSNGASIKQIRRHQGRYSRGEESKVMIFKWWWYKYDGYWIDSCDQSNSSCLSKYTWECCCMIKCKYASWRYTREELGLTMQSCNWNWELVR